MKSISSFLLFSSSLLLIVPSVLAAPSHGDLIPTGTSGNQLYYQIGGGSSYVLPPIQNTQTINLGAEGDLTPGYNCGAFNPALSLTNSLNNLKNSADNVEQTVLSHATGSLAEMPMYLLAQANPTAYNLINNALLAAHEQLGISTRSCENVKAAIARGENPYQNWATLSLGDQWKKNLSLTANGDKDMNEAKAQIDSSAGNNGVPWVKGVKDGSTPHAGGTGQPPIQVIADTVSVGYNALLLRDSQDKSPAPTGSELAAQFPTPADAALWITNVVGDQTITTCNTSACRNAQGGIGGRGLLPWITTCSSTPPVWNFCTDTIRTNLANLVSGQTPITSTNLAAVSASGLVISPQVIDALRGMDNVQQSILINKLAQEVATQKVVDRALIARSLLQTGSQVPVIAANHPAQVRIHQAIHDLDEDMQALVFESQMRKQLLSNTVTQILNYQNNQQTTALRVSPTSPAIPALQNSALPASKQP